MVKGFAGDIYLAGEDVDPLAAVMGEDWAVLKIPPSMRGPMQKYVFDLQEKIAKGRGDAGGGGGSSRMTTSFLRQTPQAMTKMIRGGGTHSLRGIRDQMDYLRKDGTVELERSDRYFGTVLDAAAEAEMMAAWQIADAGDDKADRTSHFTVSFPAGTDHRSAYLAGRDWAEALFASGKYGDVFDYFTAFHTDKAHPHMHVVVNRRGLEEGSWLKVSQRGHFDYDEMRFVQVRVAADHGIEMEATPRFARGVDERPFTDCEVQRARREERSPQARAHDVVSGLKADLAKSLFVRQVRHEASYIDGDDAALGQLMRKTAQMIAEGQRLKTFGPASRNVLRWARDKDYKLQDKLVTTPVVTIKEIQKMNSIIEAKRDNIIRGFELIDRRLAALPDNAKKAYAERVNAADKADAAQFMPDAPSLKGFLRVTDENAYRGVVGFDEHTQGIAEAAHKRVEGFVLVAGLDPEIMAERYGGDKAVPEAIAEQWKQTERAQLMERMQAHDGLSPDASFEQANEVVRAMHSRIQSVYKAARQEIRSYEFETGKDWLLQNRSGDTVNEDFAETMKDTLSTSKLRQLEKGELAALERISKDPAVQMQLARRYLETELAEASGARKGQLEQALGKLDRGDGHASGAESSRNKRGSRKDDGFGL
ncbi:MAG: relaxase/mobilization nuclease domain-containing protein [Pseudomonadota bacterium]